MVGDNMAVPDQAATISEIVNDLNTIKEKYGDVGVYVSAPVENEDCEAISAKAAFIADVGEIQALIIA